MAKITRQQIIDKLNAAGANLPDDASNEEILAAVDRLKEQAAEDAEQHAHGLDPIEAANYRRLFGR